MIKRGRYRHFKGKEYEVLDFATHSETLELMVLYRPLYGEGKLWFVLLPCGRNVEADGKLVPRFTYLSEHLNANCANYCSRAALLRGEPTT